MFFKNAHRLTYKLKFDDISLYGRKFKTWYGNVMPDWRSAADEWPLSRTMPEDGDVWGKVMKGGGNGFFLIVLGFVWWREIATSDGDKADVQVGLKDLRWVLDKMNSAIAGKKKRRATEDASPASPPSKKSKKSKKSGSTPR